MQPRKIIITVAPVGTAISSPSVNPLTPEQIAAEVAACTTAGAAMVHLHVRDDAGLQTAELDAFKSTLDGIRDSSDIIIQGSTGGLSNLTLEERCVALEEPRVEVASLNMGSVNFGDHVYVNTIPDVRYWAGRMKAAGVVPELEIFEAGMVGAARELIREGVLVPPFYFNICTGGEWILPALPESLYFTASLIGPSDTWGIIHDGMTDLSLLAAAIGLGAGVVRVGFEDSVYGAPGQAAVANVDLVNQVASLIRNMGLEVATPDEARRILGVR